MKDDLDFITPEEHERIKKSAEVQRKRAEMRDTFYQLVVYRNMATALCATLRDLSAKIREGNDPQAIADWADEVRQRHEQRHIDIEQSLWVNTSIHNTQSED